MLDDDNKINSQGIGTSLSCGIPERLRQKADMRRLMFHNLNESTTSECRETSLVKGSFIKIVQPFSIEGGLKVFQCERKVEDVSVI